MEEYKRPENMTDDEILKDIFIAAKEVFCNGLYIAANNHECGWDFLSFEYLNEWTDLKTRTVNEVNNYCLNDGRYGYVNEQGKYLIDILNENGWKYEFERVCIAW